MQRLTFYIDKKTLAALRVRQQKTGVPVAEQIRRAIDKELKRKKRR